MLDKSANCQVSSLRDGRESPLGSQLFWRMTWQPVVLAGLIFGFWTAMLALAPPSLADAIGNASAGVTDHPRVSSVRIEVNGDTTRLIFALSSPVSATAFVLADPDRAVVDLPQVDFALDPAVGQPAVEPGTKAARRRARKSKLAAKPLGGAVAGFRFGLFAPSRSRIVIDLAADSRVVEARSEQGPGGTELVVELARTDASSFAAAAAAAAKASAIADALPAAASAAAPVTAAAGQLPVVVIDPGHGGIDSGAHGAAGDEKDIVFAFAQQLVAKLEAEGRYQIVMTRTSDVFVPLEERVRIARTAHAALFVSLHADTISDAADVSGATIYTASAKASDSEAARVAAKENAADAVGGLVSPDAHSDVSDILADLTRRETRTFSHVFAHTLANYWRVTSALNKNPERSAGFVVLMAPDVPSVLLELGYLSNQQDSKALMQPEWRDKATSAVQHSIDTYFAPSNAPATPLQPVAEQDAIPAPADTSGVAQAIH